MINFNELEVLRTKEELINYFKKIGQSITEEEIEKLKKSYEKADQTKNVLTLKQLDEVAGGVRFYLKTGFWERLACWIPHRWEPYLTPVKSTENQPGTQVEINGKIHTLNENQTRAVLEGRNITDLPEPILNNLHDIHKGLCKYYGVESNFADGHVINVIGNFMGTSMIHLTSGKEGEEFVLAPHKGVLKITRHIGNDEYLLLDKHGMPAATHDRQLLHSHSFSDNSHSFSAIYLFDGWPDDNYHFVVKNGNIYDQICDNIYSFKDKGNREQFIIIDGGRAYEITRSNDNKFHHNYKDEKFFINNEDTIYFQGNDTQVVFHKGEIFYQCSPTMYEDSKVFYGAQKTIVIHKDPFYHYEELVVYDFIDSKGELEHYQYSDPWDPVRTKHIYVYRSCYIFESRVRQVEDLPIFTCANNAEYGFFALDGRIYNIKESELRLNALMRDASNKYYKLCLEEQTRKSINEIYELSSEYKFKDFYITYVGGELYITIDTIGGLLPHVKLDTFEEFLLGKEIPEDQKVYLAKMPDGKTVKKFKKCEKDIYQCIDEKSEDGKEEFFCISLGIAYPARKNTIPGYEELGELWQYNGKNLDDIKIFKRAKNKDYVKLISPSTGNQHTIKQAFSDDEKDKEHKLILKDEWKKRFEGQYYYFDKEKMIHVYIDPCDQALIESLWEQNVELYVPGNLATEEVHGLKISDLFYFDESKKRYKKISGNSDEFYYDELYYYDNGPKRLSENSDIFLPQYVLYCGNIFWYDRQKKGYYNNFCGELKKYHEKMKQKKDITQGITLL